MIKKWKLLFQYIKTIRKHTKDIKKHFLQNTRQTTYQIKDIDYDFAYRLFTVLNFPPDIEENIRKYGYYYLDNETRKFIKELDSQLLKYGLIELVGLSKADQIGPNNILIVIEYKFLKTTIIIRNIFILLLIIIIAIILIL